MAGAKLVQNLPSCRPQITFIQGQTQTLLHSLHWLRWKKCLYRLFMHLCNCGKFVEVRPNILDIYAIFPETQQSSFPNFLFYQRNVILLSCAVLVLMPIPMQKYIKTFECVGQYCLYGFSIWKNTTPPFVLTVYK